MLSTEPQTGSPNLGYLCCFHFLFLEVVQRTVGNRGRGCIGFENAIYGSELVVWLAAE